MLLGFRAKKLGRNLASELQYEDPEDPIVAQLMAQRDAKQYEPPEGFEDLKTVFKTYENDPLGLYKALATYRFNHIEDMLGVEIFSTDRLLGYAIQLILVQKWLELDQDKGTQIIDKLVKDAS